MSEPLPPPRYLQVGDVVKAHIRRSRNGYVKWIVREVDGDEVLASAPGVGSVRFTWYGEYEAARDGYGHGLKFYFVRHAGNPKPGDTWRHHNGNIYKVLMLTNLASTRDEYPITVVYQGGNGNVWSRPLSEWHRSFTEV